MSVILSQETFMLFWKHIWENSRIKQSYLYNLFYYFNGKILCT